MAARPAPQPVHLTTEELAERWHTSPVAIRIRRSRGNAPQAIKDGRGLLWPLALVEAWEQSRLARTAS